MDTKFFYVVQGDNSRCICYDGKYSHYKTFAMFGNMLYTTVIGAYSAPIENRYKIDNLNRFLKLVYVTEVKRGIRV